MNQKMSCTATKAASAAAISQNCDDPLGVKINSARVAIMLANSATRQA
jgi:hypothetical protein